jgi:hypothetical protein
VQNDQARIVFPADSRVLIAHVVESTRKSIGLTTVIDDADRAIVIKFDFLDRGDGGVIQIIYQGDPTARPEITGSIRGVPEGIRMPVLGGNLSFSDDINEDGFGSWMSSLALVVTLSVLAYCSSIFFGSGYPLTVVLLTLLGEVMIISLVGDLFGAFIRQSIGNFQPKVQKDIDR